MNLIEPVVDFVFGLGLFINALLFIPQVIKLYRTKDAGDLSKITFVGFCLTQIAAICYGYLHSDWILMIGYCLSLMTCGLVTILIFKYSKNKSNS
jgi:MtN3 and saliva related transmembrane protein